MRVVLLPILHPTSGRLRWRATGSHGNKAAC